MRLVQRTILTAIVILIVGTISVSAQRSAEFEAQLAACKSVYSFMALDTLYTVESEFEIPDGYHRADSSSLSDWSWWISHFPLWHRFKPLNDWKGKRVAEADEVSRVLYLPDRGTHMTPAAIPLSLAAEYLLWANRTDDMVIVPKAGEHFRYESWLSSKMAYGARGEVMFKPSEKREASTKEFRSMVKRAMEMTTAESLVDNCVEITEAEVEPGDLFVSWDPESQEGVVLVLVYMVENDDGERLFAVATGCSTPCDIHVPYFTHNRNDPWLALPEISQEVPGHTKQGFFRLRLFANQ